VAGQLSTLGAVATNHGAQWPGRFIFNRPTKARAGSMFCFFHTKAYDEPEFKAKKNGPQGAVFAEIACRLFGQEHIPG
jgi:hypothetical protein